MFLSESTIVFDELSSSVRERSRAFGNEQAGHFLFRGGCAQDYDDIYGFGGLLLLWFLDLQVYVRD